MARDEELLCLPLGGVGEFGCNVTLYGDGRRWIMVDCGMGFARDQLPGVDIVLPDLSWIAERRDRLDALLLTHAHEDHLGAVAHLWRSLRCPVYGTAFTLAVLRPKLAEAGLLGEVELREVVLGTPVTAGPFTVDYVHVTHSIPEPNLLRIHTAHGAVIHTGDWKIDAEPLIGDGMDAAHFQRIGDEGVLALIGDSTNAVTPGRSRSEGAVRRALTEEIGKYDRRVAVCSFASNVARIETVVRAAEANGRSVALVGRSLLRMTEAAQATGYLKDIPAFVALDEAMSLPRDKILFLCTGSQGEPRAAMTRIAQEDHPQISLEAGDAVLFSSRNIPGNELAIFDLQNRLIRRGIEVLTEHADKIHASGHPARAEIKEMYGWLRPQTVLPVHGEMAHLKAHAELAESCGAATLIPENGAMIRLAPGPVGVVDHVEIGKFAREGHDLLPVDSEVLRQRRRLASQGNVVISLVMTRKGRLLADPGLSAQGVDLGGVAAEEDLLDDIIAVLDGMDPGALRRNDQVQERVARAVRRHVGALSGKKPSIDIHLHRIEG